MLVIGGVTWSQFVLSLQSEMDPTEPCWKNESLGALNLAVACFVLKYFISLQQPGEVGAAYSYFMDREAEAEKQQFAYSFLVHWWPVRIQISKFCMPSTSVHNPLGTRVKAIRIGIIIRLLFLNALSQHFLLLGAWQMVWLIYVLFPWLYRKHWNKP